jgi:hypothetical protein
MAGAPWAAHEWLSEVLLSLAFRPRRMERRRAVDGRRHGACSADRRIERRANFAGGPLVATVAIGLSLVTASLLAGRNHGAREEGQRKLGSKAV